MNETPLIETPPDTRVIEYLEGREAALFERLRELVDTNSGLDNPSGRRACLALIERVYRKLGFACERVERPGDMTHLVARRPSQNAPKVLLLGHLDTVFDSTSGFLSMQREGAWLAGPGVGDMKGGLVVALAALEALDHIGRLDAFDWIACHNADEEVQSPTSRDLVEACARGRDFVLDFEIGRKTGAVVRSRAGVGRFFVTVHGKSAHAGMDHAAGANAILGLAKAVLELDALADGSKGTTVNVGVVRGGTKRNVVPDLAKAEIDVRVRTPDEAARIEREFARICATEPLPGTRVELLGGVGRPPWIRNAACDGLVRHFQQTADMYGITLGAEDTNGGSDANFTAALGIATIDGLGPVGTGPHTHDERIQAHTVVERAKLVALALLRWLEPGRAEIH
jgi:glutamate carboxypeptidase